MPKMLHRLLALILDDRTDQPENIAMAIIARVPHASAYATRTTLCVADGMVLDPGFRENG